MSGTDLDQLPLDDPWEHAVYSAKAALTNRLPGNMLELAQLACHTKFGPTKFAKN